MAQKIDPKAQQLSAAANRVYEDFQPPFDWAHEQGSDTLIVSLEGFKKEQLRVQITSSRLLRVSGERQIDDKRWRRFYLELAVPTDSDTNEIGAKFERGILFIKFPKLITPSSKPQTTSSEVAEAPKPQSSIPAPPPPPPPPPQSQKLAQQEAAPSKPTREEEKEDDQEAMKKKPHMEKEKEEQSGYKKDVSEGKELVEQTRGEAKGNETQEKKDVYEGRASPNLSQTQNYKDAIVGLIGEVKKQKKIGNLVMAILMVLLFLLYLKNSIKSSLGGSKTHQDL